MPTGTEPNIKRGTDEIVDGVAEVVNATLDLVGDIARSTADATSRDKVIDRPPEDAAPLDVIVHYGLVTVSNVIDMLGSAAGTAVRPSRERRRAAAHPAGGGTPRVQAGSTLRVPLSIENTQSSPMEITAECVKVDVDGQGAGKPLGCDAVRFEPPSLKVAPRDFEKLTVFVDTSAETAPGRYEALLRLGGEDTQTSVRFQVTG
jgi:hypothetical protein